MRAFAFVLGVALALGAVLGVMPREALADGAKAYSDYDVTTETNSKLTYADIDQLQLTFNGKQWYIIEDNSTAADAGTVTLLAADTSFGASFFDETEPYSNDYASSTVKGYLDSVVAGTAGQGKPDFSAAASAIIDTANGKLYLLSRTEADRLSKGTLKVSTNNPQKGGWWLRSPSNGGNAADYVDGEWGSNATHITGLVHRRGIVRPALKLDLGSVYFSPRSKSFSLRSAHTTHDFNYTASGSTIMATCDAIGCPLHNTPATLTLSANDATYTGNAYTGASLSDTMAWTNAGLTVPTIEYAGRGDTRYAKSATAPTDAGTYTASIKAGGTTATKNFTISPMALTITGATAKGRAFDGSTNVEISGVTFKDSNDQPVSLTLGEGGDYTAVGTLVNDCNAGVDKDVDVTVTLRNANYSLINAYPTRTKVTITKAAAIIADVTDYLSCTATSVNLSVAGLIPKDAVDVEYAAGTADKTGSVEVSNFAVNENNGEVTATLSNGAQNDTVTLPVTITSTNYENSTVNVVLTLSTKGEAGVSVPIVPVSKSYGDADFELEGTVNDPGTGEGEWTWTSSDPTVLQVTRNGASATVKVLKVGSATVTVKYSSETTQDSYTTLPITVIKNRLFIDALDKEIYVGDNVPSLSEPVLNTDYIVRTLVTGDGLKPAPTLTYQKNGQDVNPDNSSAGVYNIVPSGANAGDNYDIKYEIGKLRIRNKGTQTIKADDVTVTYGDTDKKVEATVTDPSDGNISFAVKEGSSEFIDVDTDGTLTVKKVPRDGKAYVTVTAAETSSYNQESMDVAVTINKAVPNVTAPTGKTLTYTGSAQELVTAGEAKGGQMWYALGTATEPTQPSSTTIPTATEIGTYYVWYRVAGDENHDDSEAQMVTSTIVEKAPEPTDAILPVGSGHLQGKGDTPAKASGKGILIGTTGEARRLEQVSLSLPKDLEGSIEYRAHLQKKGWTDWSKDGSPCGTTGEARRLEAVQVRLTGKVAETYSVWYRVHSQTWGWLGWAHDGQAAGTSSQAKRGEAVEVQVLPKGQVPEGYVEKQASYVGAATADIHLQKVGWTGSHMGLSFGTTGQARRLEAVRLQTPGLPVGGGISYDVHLQGKGWEDGFANGDLAGTVGEARRLEAVRVRLTGDVAKENGYSVWYRVHSQTYGWLGWAHDGDPAGTTGLARRAEAIDVQVLPQGQEPRGYDASKPACVNG